MIWSITFGDIIGYILTIMVGVGVTIRVNSNILTKNEQKKINQSKSHVDGDQVGGNKIGGDNNESWNQSK